MLMGDALWVRDSEVPVEVMPMMLKVFRRSPYFQWKKNSIRKDISVYLFEHSDYS